MTIFFIITEGWFQVFPRFCSGKLVPKSISWPSIIMRKAVGVTIFFIIIIIIIIIITELII